MNSEVHKSSIGTFELRISPTEARKVGGQDAIGPSAVSDQANALIRSTISPLPVNGRVAAACPSSGADARSVDARRFLAASPRMKCDKRMGRRCSMVQPELVLRQSLTRERAKAQGAFAATWLIT